MTQTVSYVLGAVAIALGVLGFFMDPILGIFEVDMLHNIVYLLVGVALIGAAAAGSASMGAKVVGAVVAVVAILGFVPPMNSVLGFIETNVASSVLQAVVAVVLLGVGFMGGDAGGSGGGMAQKMGGGQRQQMPGGGNAGGQDMGGGPQM